MATDPHAPEIMDQPVTLRDLCIMCAVEEVWLAELVAHGALHETGPALYASHSVIRVRKAKRLQQDLELNTAGIALVLELLDEIDRLRLGGGVHQG